MSRPRAHHFRGQRSLRIALRTAHIGGVALLVGALHFRAPPRIPDGVWVVVFLSGTGILLDDLYRWRAHWFSMVQFWAMVLKFGLLIAAALVPEARLWCIWAALITASVISHAPGTVRHQRLWPSRGDATPQP